MGESANTGQNGGLTRGPGDNRMESDVVKRALLGQLIKPPDTAISTPMQQAISNLQSGAPERAFGLGGGLASRLSGGAVPGTIAGNSPGFAPGSFAANAPGGQQGLQSREQLGLPSRSSYMGDFMPSAEDIRNIGLPAIRSDDKKLTKMNQREQRLTARQDRLESRIAARQADGLPTGQAERRLGRVNTKLTNLAQRQQSRRDAGNY